MSSPLIPRTSYPNQWRAIHVKPRWPEMVFAQEVQLSASAADTMTPDVAAGLSAVSGMAVANTDVIARIRAAGGEWHDVYVNRDIQTETAGAQTLRSAIRSSPVDENPSACCYGDVVILGARRDRRDDYLPVPNASIALHEIYHLFLPAGHLHIGFSHAGLMS